MVARSVDCYDANGKATLITHYTDQAVTISFLRSQWYIHMVSKTFRPIAAGSDNGWSGHEQSGPGNKTFIYALF